MKAYFEDAKQRLEKSRKRAEEAAQAYDDASLTEDTKPQRRSHHKPDENVNKTTRARSLEKKAESPANQKSVQNHAPKRGNRTSASKRGKLNEVPVGESLDRDGMNSSSTAAVGAAGEGGHRHDEEKMQAAVAGERRTSIEKPVGARAKEEVKQRTPGDKDDNPRYQKDAASRGSASRGSASSKAAAHSGHKQPRTKQPGGSSKAKAAEHMGAGSKDAEKTWDAQAEIFGDN
eukprot:TRINITY_DN1759_c0_g1_i2.p2 TRINITY_DN1759_c0_g1~~TRINITY_DN1759_c0_g1_i2.p2  ORF type:complete len:232 (-),score=77.52 TRINITY_DN1759_c0_g1_i2:22-717(-)